MNTYISSGDLNTSMVGSIVEFFPETQTATVKLHMNQFVKTLSRSYKPLPIPDLLDVPVHFVQAGGFIITVPIKPNDDCIVFFTQKGIEQWLYRGESEYLVTDGRPEEAAYEDFEMSNALCIVGMNSLVHNTANFNVDGLELRNVGRDQRITLNSDKSIEIATPTDVVVTCANLTATATGDLTIDAANINLTTAGTITMTAANIDMVKG